MTMFRAVNDGNSTHNPFAELAVAVIKRAISDYRLLGSKLIKCETQLERKQVEESMKSISRFFLSDWYGQLSGMDNGSQVLEILDQEVFGDD